MSSHPGGRSTPGLPVTRAPGTDPLTAAALRRSSCCLRPLGVGLRLGVQSHADRAQQDLIVERLFDEVDHAGAHRLDGQGDVAVARDHHHRQGHTALFEPAYQVQAAHFRHPHVGDDAAALQRFRHLQEVQGRGIGAGRQVVHFQKETERGADRLVVVDEVDDGVSHAPPVLPREHRVG